MKKGYCTAWFRHILAIGSKRVSQNMSEPKGETPKKTHDKIKVSKEVNKKISC